MKLTHQYLKNLIREELNEILANLQEKKQKVKKLPENKKTSVGVALFKPFDQFLK